MAAGMEENWPVPMRAIGAQNLLTMPGGVTQSGYLHKKGGSQWKIMKWPLRFVIIHKGCIYYFKSSTAASPQGAFSLNGYNRVMRSTEETTSSTVFPFKIIHINKKHRTWYFSAACEEERKKWMMGLRKEIDRYHEKTDMQGNLSDYSDAEKFYGSIERPVQIKYTAKESESGDYAVDEEEEEEEEEEEDDYLRPDGLSVESEGVRPMLNSPSQLEKSNKKPLPPLPPPTQRRMSHELVIIKEGVSSSSQDHLPSPSSTKTETSALFKCLSPKASPGCPNPPNVHLKSTSNGKEQHRRYSETTDSDIKVKSKFAMELNKHLQHTAGKETSLDVVSPSVLFYKGHNSGSPSTLMSKALGTVPLPVPINKGTVTVPPPVPMNKRTSTVPPPVPMNKRTSTVPPPVPMNKGANTVPPPVPMNKGTGTVPPPVPMNKAANTVPPQVLMNKAANTVPPPVLMNKAANTVPHPVPMNKGSNAAPPPVPGNKGFTAESTIFMSKEPSTASPSILTTKGCNAGSPPAPLPKGSNASPPPLPANKPMFTPIPSELVQVKPKLYKPELLPKGTSAFTKQLPPAVKPNFQQHDTKLPKPLHRSSPEGRSFRSAETEKLVPRLRSQSQPSRSHVTESDDDDYENVQLPPSVFVNTTESNDVERLFISTHPRSNPENGLYCIRNSSKAGKVLVVWDGSEKKVRNYRIFEKESKFFLEADVKFICLASMVEFYHKHTLPIHDNLRLKVPYGYEHPT
ncbi:SH3 domain-binding protein 2 [Hemiscyllium ocellatum]|uniref:SH3 domain-binding protein 2 n=1 Tax=Hemiscyllium ocellatum TaxID=170820 RepID=UPI002967029E|nr:SH3 domain-binding protein 2 [Hemiscyllium ocellatum]